MDEVRCKNQSITRQNKHNFSDIFAIYTQKFIRIHLCRSSIATVVVKYLNSTSNKNLVSNIYMFCLIQVPMAALLTVNELFLKKY